MILFFEDTDVVYAVDAAQELSEGDLAKLTWLFSGAVGTTASRATRKISPTERVEGDFVGPRREMVTPWSTNAVEITQTMGIAGIRRIERFVGRLRAAASRATQKSSQALDDMSGEPTGVTFDPMLNRRYTGLGQDIFTVDRQPEPVREVCDIAEYNVEQGLALSDEEVSYLGEISAKMGRPLTDSEVFGFSQVNSEHCRHKIFNGRFVIDGRAREKSLFQLIKDTTKVHQGRVTSAYKDNCAFIQGPSAEQFAPERGDAPSEYAVTDFESVISLKAETHNFPTTVEPFNGAATGSGGEIRDRIAGGKGAFPLAGTAVYMTAYPRLDGVQRGFAERPWLYQTPEQILIKASNGASDFGNKFGQPLVCGSLLTFEHAENGRRWGFDKVIMMAGGVGYGRAKDSLKDDPTPGDAVVLLGGDNYRIGMGGGAVSSVATGEFRGEIELNAVQRSNPEMQLRAYKAIRAVSEAPTNPIISIHDHGAGGHLNCLSELVEATGGRIDMERLPVGDPTLSAREIIGNESQERMGLVLAPEMVDYLRRVSERERAPMYVIGETTGDGRFTFVNHRTGERPIDWPLEFMFGGAPRTVLTDSTLRSVFAPLKYGGGVVEYIEKVLSLEAVACKDWLTNKVDRSVGGRVAVQQTVGEIQLPLNDCAVVALDYQGVTGVATSIGHAPVAAMIDPAEGSRLAIAEALTNLVFAPLAHGLESVSLSANWMWPCRNEGEDARLYSAVEAASEFAKSLSINIPTGKDSLSMTQKYPSAAGSSGDGATGSQNANGSGAGGSGERVLAPGTVIITAAGEVSDVSRTVKTALKHTESDIVYVDFSRSDFALGGSSLAQVVGGVGDAAPTVGDPAYFKAAFNAVQRLVSAGSVLAGHDVSAGGLVTALLEMTFADATSGIAVDLSTLPETDIIKVLFSERPSVVLQVADGAAIAAELQAQNVDCQVIGRVNVKRKFTISAPGVEFELLQDELRDQWFKTSYLLDKKQTVNDCASARYVNYRNQRLSFEFPKNFAGTYASLGIDPRRREKSDIKAAVIREKGGQCERETAWALHLAGFDVRDVTMTDLVSGRETLRDVNLIVFAGGFTNSDVLGSAKGWAGAFLYNSLAKSALDAFYERNDTLSIGFCNGCQLMVELGLVKPLTDSKLAPRMLHNDSHKFESGFVGVDVGGKSVFLDALKGSRLGVWVAHGEGKFALPGKAEDYNIVLTYSELAYPGNPNGSDFGAAGIASADGRHVAIMPHPERALKPWNWAHYPEDRAADEVSPWVEAFVAARKWVEAATVNK